jgi:hypothetical protein
MPLEWSICVAGAEICYACKELFEALPPKVVKQTVGFLFYEGERQKTYRR